MMEKKSDSRDYQEIFNAGAEQCLIGSLDSPFKYSALTWKLANSSEDFIKGTTDLAGVYCRVI